MISGIYVIYCLASGKLYVGSTKNFRARLAWHRTKLTDNEHVNDHLQSAWNKYGAGNFIFHILEEYPEDRLTAREQFWINKFRANEREHGYNKTNAVRQELPAPVISQVHRDYWASLSDDERDARHAYKRTDDGRELLRQNAVTLWTDPDYRDLMTTKVSATMREMCADPAVAAQRARISREYWANDTARVEASVRSETRWKALSPEGRVARTRGFRPRETIQFLVVDGVSKSLKEWAGESGLPYGLLLSRLKRGDHSAKTMFAPSRKYVSKIGFE